MHARHLAFFAPLTLAASLSACDGCNHGPLLEPEDVGPVDASLDGSPDAGSPRDGGADAGPPCETLLPTEPEDPADGSFAGDFGHPGVGGDIAYVSAFAFDEDDVFVGGQFSSAGSVEASNVAAWNGAAGWRVLGEGLPTGVGSLAVLADGSLVAAHAGPDGVSTRLSRWDGTSWSVYATADGLVYELHVSGTQLWAVGEFTTIGGISAYSVAFHDGTAWQSYAGLSPDAPVSSVSATSASDVCIGGTFSDLGVISARGVACWDGTAWRARSLPTVPSAWSIADLERGGDGALLVAGSFLLDASDAGGSLARWSGTAWATVGGGTMGFAPGEPGAIASVAVAGDALFVGGAFEAVNVDRAPPTDAHAAARWNGTEWSGMGGLYREGGFGFGGGVATVAVGPDGSVYFGGQLTRADSLAIGNVVRWDGVYWQGLRTPGERYLGVGNAVFALEAVGTCHTYVGGDFRYAGGVLANGIARFDLEDGYSALGEGVLGAVGDIVVDGAGVVYAAGNFTDVGGSSLRNIGSWDGTSWDGLGGGIDGSVAALALSGDGGALDGPILYAGGSFTEAGGERVTNLAAWDGAGWSDLGRGMLGHPYESIPTERIAPLVAALLVDPATGDVIIGGSFLSVGEGADAVEAHNVARWDGAHWHGYGEGLGTATESVETLTFWDGRLVAGGAFLSSGRTSVERYAVWSGTAWEQLGAVPPPGMPTDMVASEHFLYASGNFIVEDVPRHAAVYDGTTWSYLGGGLSDVAQAVSLVEGGVLVGGVFDRAGGVGSEGIAFWEFAR